MDKKILVGLIIAIIILVAGYFIFFNQPSEVDLGNGEAESTSNNQINSIDDVISKLSNSFEMGEKEETYYQMIGAYDGTKIDVDNTKIEIYQFKDSQSEAKNSAKESMDTADNIILKVDNFVILIHSKDNEFAEGIKQVLNQ